MESDGGKTIFEKIIDREIPAEILMEDEQCIVIRDINPGAPVHALIIPKQKIARLSEARANDISILGHLLLTAQQFAKRQELRDGFRVVINNGPHAGETVPHLHAHLLAGKPMIWPPC
ncbi:MAG: histidine triad nucleotide-binding protein [Puniceicoccales bacterium]|jgi:histidine triad (HIT) family protein|nr:histidine triad nucleotide-binding protein [Puniceicoccales bacterium]